jgi:hypothetical protein
MASVLDEGAGPRAETHRGGSWHIRARRVRARGTIIPQARIPTVDRLTPGLLDRGQIDVLGLSIDERQHLPK